VGFEKFLVDADVGHEDFAGERRAGRAGEARFFVGERDGDVGGHGVAFRGAGVGGNAAGDVAREDAGAALIAGRADFPNRFREGAGRSSAAADAEDGVDNGGGCRRFRRMVAGYADYRFRRKVAGHTGCLIPERRDPHAVALTDAPLLPRPLAALRGVPDEDGPGVVSREVQEPAHGEPVAAVVARPAIAQGTRQVEAFRQERVHGGQRRALHKHERRDAVDHDRAVVELFHLGGGDKFLFSVHAPMVPRRQFNNNAPPFRYSPKGGIM